MHSANSQTKSQTAIKRSKVLIQGQHHPFVLQIYQWTTVVELKQLIQKETGAAVQMQRLFHRQIELANGKRLNDYGVLDVKVRERVIQLDFKPHGTQAFIRTCPGVSSPSKRVTKLIAELNQALVNGLAPNLTIDGTGGTYLMRDSNRKVAGVFKPLNEEPFAPFNPRGHTGTLGSQTFRKGVLSGEACYREAAAYDLDEDHFSSVPLTTLAEAMHPSLCYGDHMKAKMTGKIGSLQRYEKHDGMVEDFSPTMFHRQEVQKIAVLDIRILNMDRNEGNILVVRGSNKLIPIDHGMSIPDSLDVCVYDLCWMGWPHIREPCTEETMDYVSHIDPLSDITKLKDKYPIRDICLRNMRISSTLLVRGVDSGLSLFDIGQIMYRSGYEDNPSELERLIEKATKLHKAVKKNITHMLKTEYSLLLKDPRVAAISMGRSRAFSMNEVEIVNSFKKPSLQATAETEEHVSGSDVSGDSNEFHTIQEENESDDEPTKDRRKLHRISSLPELACSPLLPRSEESAFDQELFYYIDTFMQQALQSRTRRGLLGEKKPDNRSRSLSTLEFESEL